MSVDPLELDTAGTGAIALGWAIARSSEINYPGGGSDPIDISYVTVPLPELAKQGANTPSIARGGVAGPSPSKRGRYLPQIVKAASYLPGIEEHVTNVPTYHRAGSP
jgi:hypothetical protein